MKIRIILSNSGGELDRLTLDADDNDPALASEQIRSGLEAWVLAPGDTITIKEVGYAYHFNLVCPRCNNTSEHSSPHVNCGDCLMNDVEIVEMKVVSVKERAAS